MSASEDKVGGLVGDNDGAGIIIDSYSTGDVSGDEYVGGLIGINDGTRTNSYYPDDITITCSSNCNTDGETSVANLQSEAWLTTSPNDWDFITPIWLEVSSDYPILFWQAIGIQSCEDARFDTQ